MMKHSILKFDFLILFVTINLDSYLNLDTPGRTNKFYKMKYYYGSFNLALNSSKTFLKDNPTVVYWSNGLFISETNPLFLWVADSKDHTIKLIYREIIVIVVGISQSSGKSDGDAIIASFNSPSSVVLFNSSTFPQNRTISTKTFYSYDKIECVFSNFDNHTDCIANNLENLSEKESINPDLIKLIRTDENFTVNSYDTQYLFVSDKENHCIRKVDLLNAYVTTYAGLCGEKGFIDGPSSINRLNNPDNMGIDLDGNLYVYDSGNRYIRFIDTTGRMKTLINGACFEYKMEPLIDNPFLINDNKMLCLRNWIKTSGKPDQHIYIEKNSTVCEKNYVECGKSNPLIYDRNKTLYNVSVYYENTTIVNEG